MAIKHEGLLAIDPGVRVAGYAIYKRKELLRCGLVEAPSKISQIEAIIHNCKQILWAWNEVYGINSIPEFLVIERPQIYQQAFLKGDPNDLTWLAYMGGILTSQFNCEKPFLPLPREWKGQVDKEVMNNRILESLPKREKEYVIMTLQEIKSSLRHNVLDAVGLGKWVINKENI